MKNCIADLWYGNLAPAEKCGANNTEIRELVRLIERNKRNLDASLNESQKLLLEKYTDCITEYISLTAEQAFCDGFCLSSKIWCAVTSHCE